MVEVMSEKGLKTMNERELRKIMSDLENDAKALRKNHKSPSLQETEICYIQRELEVRKRFGTSFSNRYIEASPTTLEFETNV